jgi:hypothetical protein
VSGQVYPNGDDIQPVRLMPGKKMAWGVEDDGGMEFGWMK